nr:hypothetical protein [Bradyrhizobium sp. CCBAU 45384]
MDDDPGNVAEQPHGSGGSAKSIVTRTRCSSIPRAETFRKPAGSTRTHLPLGGLSAPPVDPDGGSDLDLNGIGREQVGYDLCRPGQDRRLAVLDDRQHLSARRREHPDAAGRLGHRCDALKQLADQEQQDHSSRFFGRADENRADRRNRHQSLDRERGACHGGRKSASGDRDKPHHHCQQERPTLDGGNALADGESDRQSRAGCEVSLALPVCHHRRSAALPPRLLSVRSWGPGAEPFW